LLGPVERFLQVEAASGVVLLAAAVLALLWANSPWQAAYEALWHLPVSIGFGGAVAEQSLHFWVNDGLMTIFFLLVGLEIRREMHEGALSTWRLAALPGVAALGGIIAPALLYLAMNTDPAQTRGWPIPTATDIAFAVGALTLLGRRVPHNLRVLLLAIAIIDDVAAILIIAFFYSSGIEVGGLLIVGAGVLLILAFRRLGIWSVAPYILPGALVWFGMLDANLHPTLAGVMLGLMTPVTSIERSPLAAAGRALADVSERTARSPHDPHEIVQPVKALQRANRELLPPVIRLEVRLHPWVAYGVMPLFAFANAGVSVQGAWAGTQGAGSVFLGVLLGLVIGKPVGIFLAASLAARFALGSLPENVTARGLAVLGILAGVGFTMSIFLANLAFAEGPLLAAAKLAVLAASAVAIVVALVAGRLLMRMPEVR
jgi:NhaA family Na+:H+ antiporter